MSALCGPGCGYCGRCTAAWEREEDDEPRVEPVSVRVETRRDGYKGETFIGYTADSYERGVLTITGLRTGFERVFRQDEWIDAVAYDEQGNVLFDIVNPLQAPAA